MGKQGVYSRLRAANCHPPPKSALIAKETVNLFLKVWSQNYVWHPIAAVATGYVDMSGVLADTLAFQEFSSLGEWELSQPQTFPIPSDGVGSSAKPPASCPLDPWNLQSNSQGVEALSSDSQLITLGGLKNAGAWTPFCRGNFLKAALQVSYIIQLTHLEYTTREF